MAVRISVKDAPLVSVVVPTHNRSAMVSDCLRSLLELDYPKDDYEIVVVDGASTDDTATRVRLLAASSEHPIVKYLRNASRDANSARNAGIGAAKGELLALVDDDVLVPPGWLRALADWAARRPDGDCLGGPVLPIYECAPPRMCARHEPAGARFQEGEECRYVSEIWGCNMAIRRAALGHVGPFRAGLPVLQEWEWQQRLLSTGGNLLYLPDAWVWHRRDRSDLAVAAMLRDLFVRGYVLGSLGRPILVRSALAKAAINLWHAASTGCTRGLTECARKLGLVCGALCKRVG